ncbi:MAG: hypothetical protein QG588_2225 [Candidatus Poribacteria bacterium]|nr:hypothetical protein [Candidatus Poribacteria bacterium]
MTNYWERDFGITKTIVIAIYVSMVIYVAMVNYNIPNIQYQWGQTQDIIFIALLVLALGMFAVSIFIPKILISSEKLSERFRTITDRIQGLKSVLNLVRVVAIIMSAMGEAIAIYGLVLYLLSGDMVRPWIFFVLSAFHYAITMSMLRRVRSDIEQLSQK